eukprot:GEMP01018355.1.p1 GENE.GEMP01018355.1~~GEMP01018355.1.p1  ORF type:complete len:260 (+),score=36.33 GEMP01018355.1:75-854(+)
MFFGLVCIAAAVKIIADHTPTPCSPSYDPAQVDRWAHEVLQNYRNDHRSDEDLHLLLLIGGSGSGKGTFMETFEKHSKRRLLLNGLDEYLPLLPEYQATLKNETHVFKDAADDCYGGAIQIAKAINKLMHSNPISLAYEETGKSLKRIFERVLPEYPNHRLTVVLVHNTVSIATARAAGRFLQTGRYSPDDYIKNSFANNMASFDAVVPIAAEAVYCDNSCLKYGTEFNCLTCFRVKRDEHTENLIPDDMLREEEREEL